MKTSSSSRKSKSSKRRSNYRTGRPLRTESLEERLLLSSTLGGAPCSDSVDRESVESEAGHQPDAATCAQEGTALGIAAELNFVPDPGVRIDNGAVPEAGIDQKTGEVFLYYSIGPDKYRVTSLDGGLSFTDPETPTDSNNDPRGVLMPGPDESGNPVWRRLRWEPAEGAFISLVSGDGASYSPEEGVRYDPPDTENPGVYTVFTTAEGRVGLMYIGDMGTTTGNVRLAYSDDNGESFRLADDNPLGDAGSHDEGLNQRDPAANLLEDGRIRVYTMVQGGPQAPHPGVRAVTSIFSFTSDDDGSSFEADAGVRLAPEDFSAFDVWSLNDPSVVQLPDGRYRMYVAGLISEDADASDAHWVILSATSESPDGPGHDHGDAPDAGHGDSIPQLQGPTGSISDSTPGFHWNAVPDASEYAFQVLLAPSGQPHEPIEASPSQPDDGSGAGNQSVVPTGSGEVLVVDFEDGSLECRPVGEGPFPAVLYNHGGLGTSVGGDLMGTCVALAEAGYYARSEMRPASVSLQGQVEDVLGGLDQLRNNPDVDSDQIAIMGFSRGGLLALDAALARPGQIESVLLFAPAPGRGAMTELLQDVSSLEAPVEVFIAENDSLLELAGEVEQAFNDAGKTVRLTVYESYAEDGHDLFKEVRDSYWNDVLDVLGQTLGQPADGDGPVDDGVGESPVAPRPEAPAEPVVFDAVVSETSIRVPELAAGSYVARVRAIDELGEAGRWSRFVRFRVTVDQSEVRPVAVRFEAESGRLTVLLGEAASVSVQAEQGSVAILVDGVALTPERSLPAEAVRSLAVIGSSGADRIDLGRVTSRDFANLEQVLIEGGDGDDRLVGSERSDKIRGGEGDDVLNGKRGDDHLDGGPGNDTLAGGAGADILSGGLGDDVLNGHAGIDMLVESGNSDFHLRPGSLTGSGNDQHRNVEQARLTGGRDDNRINASEFDGPVTIVGGSGDDVLLGGSADDRLEGGPGNDRLNGRGGNDRLDGQDDDDRVMGGGGNDHISGGGGDDLLKGQGGNDLLSEVADTDFRLTDFTLDGRGANIVSGFERARLEGGAGDNRIDARDFSGSTTLLGQAGDDLLRGGQAYDRIDGGDGNDRMAGFDGNDLLIGRGGRDVMIGGRGEDRIFGGADNDLAMGGDGNDRIDGQGGSRDTLAGGAGEDRVFGDVREIDEVFQYAADWIDEA